ncbi:shikimate kinase [Rhabdothermincola sediminis]|uniref:shikimate kinase n=1 Tax=Rhabdothermincola sediminis TaxID=2751370 RepID=UPI001AA08F48|nr:shikimate kinase [Rhabdothermincola sediminis]
MSHVVLIGMMGAGKTTVGRLVARRLGRPFHDSDEAVEARTGRTIAELFAEGGEPAFRAVEAEVLRDLLATEEPAVIAAAGGTVLDAGSRAALRDAGTVVWLRAEPALLAERARTGDHRPLVAEDPAGMVARLAGERSGLYQQTAHVVVDVDQLDADEVAEQVIAAVEEGAR